MKIKYTHFILSLILLLANCQKDEEIITGAIAGKIYSYDQYGKMVPDQSGVTVTLSRDTGLVATAVTDARGQYSFEDLPYGKYAVSLEKNLFIQSWGTKTVYHAGGYSPTLANYDMNEIPTYELSLDSVGYYAEAYRLIVYLKFNGDTVLPDNSNGMRLTVFAGNSPEVTKDNYVSAGKSFLTDFNLVHWPGKTAVYAYFHEYDMDQNFALLKNGRIYIRLYPIASGQGYWINQYYPEALGPASSVVNFLWDEVVGSGSRK
jgi:hypothetical protein